MYAKKFGDNLKIHIDKLTDIDKKVFDRIYRYSQYEGGMLVPEKMHDWVSKTFGSVEAVSQQEIIKVNNIVTHEGAIFNELRTSRPIAKETDSSTIDEIVSNNKNKSFSTPIDMTPSDLFGRIEKENSITAANVAKYDGLHSLIISKKENPLDISKELINDYFTSAYEWYKKANESNPKAIYPFFMWNCLWKAGASLVHGHAQITLTQDMPYSKIELLRQESEFYQQEYNSNYFKDDFKVHKKLGLGFVLNKCNVQMKLTPIKEKEIRITSNSFDNSLFETVYSILHSMTHHLGVQSFNIAVYMPPLIETLESWDHMPFIVQIVDRGDLNQKTTDFGAMELYAQSVIGSNPYKLMENIFNGCIKRQ